LRLSAFIAVVRLIAGICHHFHRPVSPAVSIRPNAYKTRELFTATGSDDLRNLLCVAGLDIDMKGFRGRTERYFVPWQACWKRHGYCCGNIYPLLQNELYVALMNVQGVSSE